MTQQPARLRRAMITAIAGVCASTGLLAPSAFAVDDPPGDGPALQLSAIAVRPGVPFAVNPAAACPAEHGVQTVEISFTDAEDTSHLLDSVETGDDGSWAATSLWLPVAAADSEGGWSDTPVAVGAGAVEAVCLGATGGPAEEDDLDAFTEEVDEPEFDEGPGDDEQEPTQAYQSAAVEVSAPAGRITTSATNLGPGAGLTVTAIDPCPAAATRVELGVVPLGPTDEHDEGADDGSEEGPDNDLDTRADPDDAASVPVSGGTWASTTLNLPAGAGDHAVTATCYASDEVAMHYDAEALAVGTIMIGTPTCTAKGAQVGLRGTYSSALVVRGARRGAPFTLPGTVRLAGEGPWSLELRSATTGLKLTKQTVSCPKPAFELDVTRVALSAGRVVARVCNVGSKPVSALLQLADRRRFSTVDDARLAPGKCASLVGGRVGRGEARGRVMLDAPGRAGDEVAETFSLRRGRR